MRHGGRIRTGALLAGAACATALLAGCGGGKSFADRPRPPALVQLSGVITNGGVTVSPDRVGAGPVEIIVSNQTGASHTLVLDGPNIAPVHTKPIAPSNTARIKRTLAPGAYTVSAGAPRAVAREITPARLIIGKPRPDSNEQVALP